MLNCPVMKTKKILFMYFLLVLSKVSKRRMWSFIHSFIQVRHSFGPSEYCTSANVKDVTTHTDTNDRRCHLKKIMWDP